MAMLSTEINSAAKKVGFERAIELVAKAGFTAWDFSMFNLFRFDRAGGTLIQGDTPLNGPEYTKYAERLKRIGLDNGIVCNQSHAPFPTGVFGAEKYVLRAIECTAIAGGKICVVHPDNDKSADQNAEFFMRLLPFAKECGVKIATENMWNWDNDKGRACAAACSNHQDFLSHILAVNDEYFVACLDIGHAEMEGLKTGAVKMIETLCRHLQALHIHDNDLIHDSHALPYTMKINFDNIAKALKKIGYAGDFTMEADTYLNGYLAEDVPLGLEKMQLACQKFYQTFLDV